MVKFFQPKRTPPAKKRAAEVLHHAQIDSVSAHGEGIVLSHKPPIFVQGALPSETVSIRVTSKKSRSWHGGVKQRPDQSHHKARQTPICKWVDQCGGCTTQHAEPQQMLSWKQQALDRQFTRSLGIETLPWQTPLVGPDVGYRRKARLAYDGRNPNNIKLGFKAAGDKQIVSINQCEVLVPALQGVLDNLHQALTNSATQPIGHITLLAYGNGVGVTVNFVRQPNSKVRQFWQELNDHLNKELGRVDVFLHEKQQPIDVLSRQPAHPLSIEVPIDETNRAKLFPDANDFIQVNGAVNQKMIGLAMHWLGLNKQEKVLELFAGLGNFTHALAARAQHVYALEGSDIMVQKASDGAQLQGMDNIVWRCADLTQQGVTAKLTEYDPDAILLDPSRDGAEQVCCALANSKASRIVYVSCNPQTWLRDARHLLNGQFNLAKLTVMDMFPYTPHTELMALFERK